MAVNSIAIWGVGVKLVCLQDVVFTQVMWCECNGMSAHAMD